MHWWVCDHLSRNACVLIEIELILVEQYWIPQLLATPHDHWTRKCTHPHARTSKPSTRNAWLWAFWRIVATRISSSTEVSCNRSVMKQFVRTSVHSFISPKRSEEPKLANTTIYAHPMAPSSTFSIHFRQLTLAALRSKRTNVFRILIEMTTPWTKQQVFPICFVHKHSTKWKPQSQIHRDRSIQIVFNLFRLVSCRECSAVLQFSRE